MAINILLVDDHKILRQGLRSLLEQEADFAVVGEASTGRAAVELAEKLSPDVVVMDVRMPDLNGIDATRQVLASSPRTKVIGLSAESQERMTVEMLRAGASGYVLKESAFDELVTAIRTVLLGKVYLTAAVATVLVSDYLHGGVTGRATVFEILSPREREVLQLIAEGRTTKEAAHHLNVSVKTVETHRRNMMEKLKVDGVAALVKYAAREGLITI